jgi:hypothetical protein
MVRKRRGNTVRGKSSRGPICHIMAQKFALRLILLANQLVEDGMVAEKSEIIDEIRQSIVIVGLFMARLTVRESPSKVT